VASNFAFKHEPDGLSYKVHLEQFSAFWSGVEQLGGRSEPL
jgi:hypothetical protein